MILSLRFLYLLFYIALASQGLFYWLGPANALEHISLESFIEQRKAVDLAIGNTLRVLYLLTVLGALTLLVLHLKESKSWLFAILCFSFLCVSIDLWLALTKSMPLNAFFNQHINGSMDLNGYAEARIQWLYYIRLRGVILFMGLLSLLGSMRWR